MHGLTDFRILVVEDDPRMCESIRYLLSFHGFDVQISMNVSDALNSLLASKYDLVLLDLQLGDQSGFVIMDYLTERKLDARVIIVTGQDSQNQAITALKKGATDYLKKPFEPDILLESVNKVLSLQKHQRESDVPKSVIVSSRERYRNIVDSQKDFLCRLNRDFEVTFVNKTYADYWGHAPRAIIGQPYKAFIHDSIHRTLFNNLSAVRSGSTPVSVEHKIVDTHGRMRWQQWQFHGILDDQGNIFEIQCIGRDVTRSKMLTKEIEEEKEKFRQLAEITSDWIWEVDNNGVYTYASPVVYELLGYRPEEVLGKQPFDFMVSEEAQRLKLIFQEALINGRSLKNIENINRHKNGALVTLETSGVPILNEVGAVVGYRGIDRNITDRKRIQTQLKEESKKLRLAISKVKQLSGYLPICSHCKKIRDDMGYWTQIETYIHDHSEAEFSHGICQECAKKYYPDMDLYDEDENQE